MAEDGISFNVKSVNALPDMHVEKEKVMSFQEILNQHELVLVDFHAVWCGPCKMLAPVLQELHREMGHTVKILKVDVDKNPQASEAFRITGVPTMILFKHGQPVWRQSGYMTLPAIKSVILDHQN